MEQKDYKELKVKLSISDDRRRQVKPIQPIQKNSSDDDKNSDKSDMWKI